MRRTHVLLVALWSLLPVTALAQDAGPPAGRYGGPGMTDPDATPIRMLLENYRELRFDGEQRAALEELQDSLVAKNRAVVARMRELMPMRGDGAPAAGQRGRPDREAMQRMQKMRPLMEEHRKNEEEAIRAALDLFEGPQRKVAEDLISDYRRKNRPARSGGRSGGGWDRSGQPGSVGPSSSAISASRIISFVGRTL